MIGISILVLFLGFLAVLGYPNVLLPRLGGLEDSMGIRSSHPQEASEGSAFVPIESGSDVSEANDALD